MFGEGGEEVFVNSTLKADSMGICGFIDILMAGLFACSLAPRWKSSILTLARMRSRIDWKSGVENRDRESRVGERQERDCSPGAVCSNK